MERPVSVFRWFGQAKRAGGKFAGECPLCFYRMPGAQAAAACCPACKGCCCKQIIPAVFAA